MTIVHNIIDLFNNLLSWAVLVEDDFSCWITRLFLRADGLPPDGGDNDDNNDLSEQMRILVTEVTVRTDNGIQAAPRLRLKFKKHTMTLLSLDELPRRERVNFQKLVAHVSNRRSDNIAVP